MALSIRQKRPRDVAAREQGKRRWKRGFRKNVFPWLFIAPITLVHLGMVIIPSIFGLYFSLTEWPGVGVAEFVGLENYRQLFFEDTHFRQAFSHNLMWLSFFLTIPFVMSLSAAGFVAQIRRGAMFFRTLLFMPYVLPAVVVAFIWRTMMSPRIGLGVQLARWGLDIPWLSHSFLGDPDTALWAVAFVANWPWWGFLMTLFLAAMQAIAPELYDAAKIDGANRWQEFWNITIPGIRPTLVFMYLMTTIWSFTSFGYVWVLTQGGPGFSTELVATYLYKQAFRYLEVGYGAAIGLTVSAFAGIVVVLSTVLRRRGWEI